MTASQNSAWSKWLRYRKLPSRERKIVLSAMALLPLTKVGLRFVGFRRWKRLIERVSAPVSQQRMMEPSAGLKLAETVARAAASAERHSAGTSNCLERSLTLWWLLRREGIDGELHIGARKNHSHLEAHAWVELRGTILNESADIHKHYSRFDAPIASPEDASHSGGEPAS